MQDLIFNAGTPVHFASNTFINVPVVLQYDNTPLIEVVQAIDTNLTTQFRIFHPDGTYLAKVKGVRVFPTEAGKKAGVTTRHQPGLLVCEREGVTLFELRRDGAGAVSTQAEIHTFDGSFIRADQTGLSGLIRPHESGGLQIGGLVMLGNLIVDTAVGIRVGLDGSVSL